MISWEIGRRWGGAFIRPSPPFSPLLQSSRQIFKDYMNSFPSTFDISFVNSKFPRVIRSFIKKKCRNNNKNERSRKIRKMKGYEKGERKRITEVQYVDESRSYLTVHIVCTMCNLNVVWKQAYNYWTKLVWSRVLKGRIKNILLDCKPEHEEH